MKKYQIDWVRFPRPRGDEPGGWDWIKDAAEFSPPTRG